MRLLMALFMQRFTVELAVPVEKVIPEGKLARHSSYLLCYLIWLTPALRSLGADDRALRAVGA